MRDGEPVVQVQNLTVRFGDREVLSDVSAAFPRGEISVILGASGSGKTTLLKHVIGLMSAPDDTIRVFGRRLATLSGDEFDALRRRIGMLFQHGALLNSVSIHRNTRVPLEQHTSLPDSIIDSVVRAKLGLVGLAGSEAALPDELSGGMRKRAGLARAMALDPELLLCDEPSSGLDPPTAEALDRLLVRLHAQLDMSMIIISHDLVSVRRVAHRVFFLHEGRIRFSGSIEEAEQSALPELRDYFRAAESEEVRGAQ